MKSAHQHRQVCALSAFNPYSPPGRAGRFNHGCCCQSDPHTLFADAQPNLAKVVGRGVCSLDTAHGFRSPSHSTRALSVLHALSWGEPRGREGKRRFFDLAQMRCWGIVAYGCLVVVRIESAFRSRCSVGREYEFAAPHRNEGLVVRRVSSTAPRGQTWRCVESPCVCAVGSNMILLVVFHMRRRVVTAYSANNNGREGGVRHRRRHALQSSVFESSGFSCQHPPSLPTCSVRLLRTAAETIHDETQSRLTPLVAVNLAVNSTASWSQRSSACRCDRAWWSLGSPFSWKP